MKSTSKLDRLKAALKAGTITVEQVLAAVGEHSLNEFNKKLASAAKSGDTIRVF